MGSFRSKEDDVAKISISIFVSNFPDSVSAKDLFHSCKQYGHVMDSFIPMKRFEDNKRFGFVRFINVFNMERLVNNLCTIWLNRCKLHANIARFNRDQKNGNKYKTANQKKHEGRKNTFYDPSKEAGTFDSRNSFVNVLKGTNMVKETDSSPVIVLEEDCLNSKDLSNSLIGRVKDVGSLSNLKKVLCNEGFDNIFVRYMGELWVLLEFDNTKAKELFRDNVGVGSWFSVLRQASHDFTPEGRIAWVDVEGIPFKFWSGKTFKKIATKWGELLDVDDHDEMSFHSKRICIHTKICSNICENFKIVFKGKVHWIRAKEATGWIPEFSEDEEDDDHSEQEFISSEQSDLGLHIDGEDNGASEVPETIFENSDGMKERQSEDPFGLYSILNKNKVKSDVIREVNDENPSLKYPPGFTPSVEKNGSKSKDDQVQNISDNQLNGDNESVHQVEREDNRNSDGAKTNSTGSRKFKMSEIPRTGGSILSVMEEIVKVGITMGYNMDGCLAQKAKKDWVKELCNKNKVSFVGLQETKMESIDLLSVRLCWGNVNFDYVHSDSIGNSGGILCIWDPNSFRKDSVTVSDYFVIVRGVWIKSGMDILIVVVYAPHDVRDKRLLWDYLSHVSNQWAGEVVMMGDFNEVRYKSDRFGSNFNAHGADIFNNFIINAGLEEVPLGGSAYTWCHKSASKMSKLDRQEFFSSLSETDRGQKGGVRMAEQTIHRGPRWVFTFGFYRHFWSTIKNDVFEAIKYFFFTCGEIPKGCNSTFIALIPKNLDANMVKDFRPISLIGSIYKIIAKILTNRLVGVLGDIVNEVQSAFISERQILDGLFILNEIMQWCRRRKKQSLIFKVDFEKAYDSVRWDFLDDILVKFGFDIKWRGWIQNCLNSSKGSILVNGSPTEEFQFYKGLKQGDPLSPFLFILLIAKINISHIFYADDAIFLGQWNDSNIDTLVHVMECFYRVSGLRINLCKSKIMGTKVGENMSRVARWMRSIVKISIDADLPICAIYKVPSSVLHLLESIRSHFFHGHILEEIETILVFRKTNGTMKASEDVFPRLSGVEEFQLDNLSRLISMITLSSAIDRYVWSLENSGEFSVKSIRQVIDANCFPVIHSATRWVKSVPLKVNIMAWKIKMDGLPTRMNISRRGIEIDSIVCPICNSGAESSCHIFFQCNLVRQLARKISSWWNVDYVDVSSYEEWYTWLVSLRLQANLKAVFEGIFYCLWWSVWMFRNKILFEKDTPSQARIFDNIVSNSYYWCKFRCKASFKWIDWLKNSYFVIV
ncbi:RNA-directed DNA polymerase, eukaryota, reverse transcriptase zinc-binding domain protein [Tanacetum coccineum]|uniref:RNA-directed DNA polymerase, eukaryota, reverse transcriptase zinc-binding domain protein n=1 Tax=Tanacetum coccineum TaxID=301880 RepID=A0ABQ5DKF5_9ASTR